MEEEIKTNHTIIVENRKKLTLTGIKEVISFDDETIMLESCLGRLAVKGFNLHILNFNNENGELSADGKIHALIYTAEEKNGGFLSRILK